MKIFQKSLKLPGKKRGFHLISDEISCVLKEIPEMKAGICQIFIQHTSASLTINENADPSVRKDFETWFSKVVPERVYNFEHDEEGADDMPAHIKTALLGTSVMIPIMDGKLALGRWQGVYLCEHRNHGGDRSIIVTVCGE